VVVVAEEEDMGGVAGGVEVARARTGTKDTTTTGTRATAMDKATDKATDMAAMATMTTLLDITAMGVATTTTRAMQAMGKLQDVEATRVATSHTDHK